MKIHTSNRICRRLTAAALSAVLTALAAAGPLGGLQAYADTEADPVVGAEAVIVSEPGSPAAEGPGSSESAAAQDSAAVQESAASVQETAAQSSSGSTGGYAVFGGGTAGGPSGGGALPNVAFYGSSTGKIGPGFGSTAYQGLSMTSPDWADYKETGGTAQGALSVSNAVPAGCVDSCAMEVSSPIVQNADKYSYDFMVHDLNALRQRYGSRMSFKSLATTPDGRSVYEVVIGNQGAATHVLITGAIHGREHITANLVMKQIEYILAFADNGCFDGRRLSTWLDEVCLHFVPMINPDGVSISQFGTAGLNNKTFVSVLEQAYANDLAMQRTTLDFETYLTRWKANARGVNLNDNFNALTQHIIYRTDQPSGDLYYGRPGSEPETVAMQQLIDSRHFKAIVNYHATGSVIYWDFTENKLREHSRDLANNIRTISSYTLQLTGAEGGSVKAYAGTRRNPSTCLTVEVGVSQCPVNPAEFPVIWTQNKFVPFYTMKWAKEKGK